VSSKDFVAGYVAPQYVIEGITQQRRFYSLTGRTGEGKTAVMLSIARHLAGGIPIGELEVERCRVLYLAGENPDDVRGRWIAMAEHLSFDASTIDVHFIAGAFKISKLIQHVAAEVKALDGVGAIMVDTSATFFEGDEENDNVQLGNHARMLRQLTELPGEPLVIVGCHPVKHATNENLIPRGGGAFLAEVDGNLTCICSERLVELHWAGKFRGADFDPLHFELGSVTAQKLRDSKGRQTLTVIAKPIGQKRQEELKADVRSNQEQVLLVLDQSRGLTLAKIAEALDWRNKKGEPLKAKAQRAVDKLKYEKLVERTGAGFGLTRLGKRAAKHLREA
jgi:hypothetical protein